MTVPAVTRRCRATGLPVTVASADDLGLEDSPETRWYTVCDEHGQATGHATLSLARAHAADPLVWCEVCNGNDPGSD